MSESIEIRHAVAEDKDWILPFCRQTFWWGDYIHEVWDLWLEESDGQTFVGVVDGRAVGMIHLALLDEGVAWMEGMRVHPDFRRRGVASAMDAAGRAFARERGYRLARLATARENHIAQKTLTAQGYSFLGQYTEWKSDPIGDQVPTVQPAIEQDWKQVLALQREFSLNPIIATPEWRWQALSDAKLGQILRRGEVRSLPSGYSILRETMFAGDMTLMLHALVGDDDAMHELAYAARVEAGYRGFSRIEADILDDEASNRAVERAGFQRQDGMLIYEQAI